ncbi:MAG: DNRLRE domain-containing protein [Planctomycetes bacterium]|nr:DNRLRE domain-containing protein [Planctomycetota bacterium]
MRHTKRHAPRLLASAALLVGGPLLPSRADLLVTNPSADQSIGQGGSPMHIADGPFLFAGDDPFYSDYWRSVLRFDLTSIPPGSLVHRVEVILQETATVGVGPGEVALRPALTAWTEGTATWFAPWNAPGGDFGAESAVTDAYAPGPTVFASTPALVGDVQTWVDLPASNHGWFAIERTFGAALAYWLARTSPDPALWPVLIVEYTLPPANHCVGAPNSAGTSATLGWTGSFAHAQNAFTLTLAGGVPNVAGIFFCGDGEQQTPWGNGFLCADGQLVRLPPAVTLSPSGAAARTLDLDAGAGLHLVPGSTWSFQCKYRDVPAGGALFNSSDALRVTFAP